MKKFLILLVIVSFYSCANTDDGTKSSLPAITSEGKNTFGCKIDGQLFLPKDKGGFSAGYTEVLRAQYAHFDYDYYGYKPGYHLSIKAYNALTKKSISITLFSPNEPIISGKTYPIVLKADGAMSAQYDYSTTTKDPNNPNVYYYNSFDYITTDEYNGEITFNLVDESKKIISGVFYFNCINPETNETSEIFDGRFDINYEAGF